MTEVIKKVRKTGIEYKFNEYENLKALKDYVDSTYDQHYSQTKYQSTDFILDCGTVKDSVSAMSSSMSRDMAERKARIEQNCLKSSTML